MDLKRTRRLGAVVTSAAVAGVAFGACADSPSSPADSGLQLEIVYGNGQQGLIGLNLPEPIVVRVVDAAGHPRPGVGVEFEVLEGGGKLEPTYQLSRGLGLASTRWKLGEPVGRPQAIRARISGVEGSPSVSFTAGTLGPDQTDVVVFRNALGPLRGVLVLRDGEDGLLDIVQERPAGDTIVPLQPMGAGPLDVLVFPQANPPQRTTVVWTEGIDTAVVDLRPPLRIPFTFNVFAGPFQDRVDVIKVHMARAQEIWDQEGMGITFGEVTFVDRIEEGREVGVDISGACQQPMYGETIKVDYVHWVQSDYLAGYACGNQVFMGVRSEAYPALLAHEVGHLFSLPHSATGLMVQGAPGPLLTDGEVFSSHFNERSVLNWMFGYNPAEVRRLCLSYLAPGPCLPMAYQLPG